jgi:hypothetical protein
MEPEASAPQSWPQPGQGPAQQTAQQVQPGPEPGPLMPPTSAFEPPAGPPMAMQPSPLLGLGATTGMQMKLRSPVGVWALSLVTFGIYGLVYWYKTHTELALFDPRQKISPVFELMSIWLLAITIVLPIMSIVGLGGKIRAAQAAVGQTVDCSGGLGLLLAFLGGFHVIYYQSKLNQVIGTNSTVPAGQPITLAS